MSKLAIVKPEPFVPPLVLVEAEDARLRGDFKMALDRAHGYLENNLDSVHALVLCGNVLMDTEKWGMAHALLQRAAKLAPDMPIIWNNLGICFDRQERLDDAERCFIKALNINPNDDLALANISYIYIKKSNPRKALNCAEKALRLNPKEFHIKSNLANAHLMLGNWKEGWSLYDANLGQPGERRERNYGTIPRWTGVEGLSLVAYGEQGIGDAISFASCIPDLMRENKVVIEVEHRLQGLFLRSFDCPVYGTQLFKGGLSWPLEHDLDAKVALGSLPGFYRNSLESFPGTPYLVADPERRIGWRAILDSLGPKKKIGISWSGGIKRTGTSRRSIPLADMLPILRQDATFISLQYKHSPEVFDVYQEHGIVIHHWAHATETDNYDDTAALVAELDLVITVQQSVVHLAGGLGVPCWTMVPSEGALWRYGISGSDFPWAKSVKLYRNKSAWVHTIAEVASDLRKFLND